MKLFTACKNILIEVGSKNQRAKTSSRSKKLKSDLAICGLTVVLIPGKVFIQKDAVYTKLELGYNLESSRPGVRVMISVFILGSSTQVLGVMHMSTG